MTDIPGRRTTRQRARVRHVPQLWRRQSSTAGKAAPRDRSEYAVNPLGGKSRVVYLNGPGTRQMNQKPKIIRRGPLRRKRPSILLARQRTFCIWEQTPPQHSCSLCGTKQGPFDYEQRPTGPKRELQRWPYCVHCWQAYNEATAAEWEAAILRRYEGFIRFVVYGT